jgi:hypothetical protein
MILQNYIPDFFDLVWLSLTLFGLKIENLVDTILGEDMVIPFYTIIKTKALEQGA